MMSTKSNTAKKRLREGEDKEMGKTMPQKKNYRQRAHCNPLSHNDAYDYPADPSKFDETAIFSGGDDLVRFVDVGCGFGGLTFALAELFPTKRILGEFGERVCGWVELALAATWEGGLVEKELIKNFTTKGD